MSTRRAAALATALAACAGAAPPAREVAAIARAERWVVAGVPYCQAINHARDNDPACPATCTRPDEPAWDDYRSDCSGLISWAWGLPSAHGGRITRELAPFVRDVSVPIAARELAPGDAVNNASHAMLFARWLVPGTRALFIEEPGCTSPTPYAHELALDVAIVDDTVIVGDRAFTAIRRREGGGDPPR